MTNVGEPMKMRLDRASVKDVNELLSLYFTVYGRSYPLAVGTDPDVMRATLENPDHRWIVVREPNAGLIVAAILCEADLIHRIGRLQAMVVHPEYRGQHLASLMICDVIEHTVGSKGQLDSIYATTRTVSIGPQAVFLNHGFLPLGIFPNAHRLKNYETLTLTARFRDGILEGRRALPAIPEKLVPIVQAFQKVYGQGALPLQIAPKDSVRRGQDIFEYEFILAHDFVRRRFNTTFKDPYEKFYPFHEPNLLISAKNGGPELYAYFSSQDGYCTIVSNSVPFWSMSKGLESLMSALVDFGASYVEILMSIENTDSLTVLLENQFLPSAYYPAMQNSRDFVLLSRSAEPLNFKGMFIDRRFKPYVDQLVRIWKEANLDVVEIIDEIS